MKIPDSDLCVAELGFGTGSNFLSTWHQWNQATKDSASTRKKLTYFAIDKQPLTVADMRRAHEQLFQDEPEFQPLSECLLSHYPYSIKGFHLLPLSEMVDLVLIWDDTPSALKQMLTTHDVNNISLNTKVDYWMCDGVVTQQPQLDLTIDTPRTLSQLPNWHIINSPTKYHSDKKEVTIVGAGIAGCCTANALARRGWKVTLMDRHSSLGGHCIDNETTLKQVALYAKLSLDSQSTLGQFALSTLCYAQRFYKSYWQQSDGGTQCGLAQVATSEKQQQQYLKLVKQLDCSDFVIFCNSDELTEKLGYEVQYSGLWFEKSGWIEPEKLCDSLIQHPNIQWLPNTSYQDSKDNNPVIFAVAGNSNQFEWLEDLPIKPLAGQIDFVEASEHSKKVRAIVCTNHTLMPANKDNQHYLGSSYRQSTNLDYSQQESDTMRSKLFVEGKYVSSQIAIRATTPDFLPMVGAIADKDYWLENFKQLKVDAKMRIDSKGQYLPNRYVITGMGSRGFCYAPLCAEVLAAELSNEPIPVPLSLYRAIQPARFLLRDIAKQNSNS